MFFSFFNYQWINNKNFFIFFNKNPFFGPMCNVDEAIPSHFELWTRYFMRSGGLQYLCLYIQAKSV